LSKNISTNSERQEQFNQLIKSINKHKTFTTESGDNVISKLGDNPREIEVISSGSLVLDSILGGGLPKGRIVEIYGPESSGKTSVALTVAGNVQANGGNAALIDLENALDPSYAKKLGVDIENLAVSQPDDAEQALDLLVALCSSQLVDLVIVDSLAALTPRAVLDGTAEQQTIGLVARLLSTNLKKIISLANKNGVTVILINQIRDKIGGFSPVGTPETTTGGRATKFYASQRIDIRRREIVKEGKKEIGTLVRMKVVKNKVAPPFREGFTVLTFNHGINRQAEMIEVGPEAGVVGRPNNRTYVEVETGEIIAKSKADAIARLESDPEMFERLSKALADALKNKDAKVDETEAPKENDDAEEVESKDDE